jgi:hypothetical protein
MQNRIGIKMESRMQIRIGIKKELDPDRHQNDADPLQ